MSKVLLVYEDYSEMMHIESVLKKVGFDVLAITNEFTMSQQILAFNPDIVIGYGKGPKVSTIGVGRRLKEMPRWTGKSVLIFPGGVKPDPLELARSRMDMALEAPIDINRLLQVLASLSQQDPQALVERMMKAVAQETQTQTQTQKNAPAAAPVASAKDGDTVYVSGAKEAPESWNVKNTRELEEFNRMMGITSPAPTTPAPSAAAAPSAATVAGSAPSAGASPSPAGLPNETKSAVASGSDSQFVRGSGFPDADATLVDGMKRQLSEATSRLSQKMKNYERFTNEVIPGGKVGLKRTEVKKAQKGLQKDWSPERLKSQDEARKAFTRSLFKKKD